MLNVSPSVVVSVLAPLVLVVAAAAQRRSPRSAATLVALIGVGCLLWTGPPLLAWLSDGDAFVRLRGRAALAQLPLAFAVTADAAAVVIAALASSGRPRLFWTAWILCWPPVALVVWLTFFWRLF